MEPFAGLGRISKHVNAEKKVLNDKSDYACKHNRNSGNIVTQEDFIECVKRWDSEDTYFFFDPPWEMTSYSRNPRTVCDRTISEYYQEILDLCKTMKGNWMVAGRSSGKSRSTVTVYFKGYYEETVVSNKRMYGFRAKTKLFSNLPFIRHAQTTLVNIMENKS